MKFLVYILFLTSITLPMPTKSAYPIRLKEIPLKYQSDYSSIHPVFADSSKYVFFFTSRKDIEDSLGYIPYIIGNELRIIKARDKSIISRIPIVPYNVSKANNQYLLNRKLIDNDEFFEVTECFYQKNVGPWFRIIDHNGNVLLKSQGMPSIHTMQGKKSITICKKEEIVTYFLSDVLPKSMSSRKHSSLGNLLNSLYFNILYNKGRNKVSLKIEKKTSVSTYKYNYKGYQYITKQGSKYSSYSQKK